MILCFDIGGSRIKAASATGGQITPLGDTPTPTTDFAAFLDALRRFVTPAHRAVSISIAGVVDPDSQRIKVANIPCADGRALAPEISAALSLPTLSLPTLILPTLILNDADCFTLAEARQGAGQGHRNVFGIILGTGVGGGLVIDGKLVSGPGGFAGEWGHGPVAKTQVLGLTLPEFPCGCGQIGCIDAVGSARGIEKLHHALHGTRETSRTILTAWHATDPAATQTVSVWAALVAPALAMVLNTVGASIVPVGGGLSGDTALVSLLDSTVRSMILRQTDRPLIVPAECRIEPGLIGAAEAGLAAFG